MALPNTFFTQPTGNVSAAKLDENFTYVNAAAVAAAAAAAAVSTGLAIFNPVNYGAVANSVTDNTAAFAAMMAAIYASGKGAIIWVPPSSFGQSYFFAGASGGTGPGWVIDPQLFGGVNNVSIIVQLNGALFRYTGSDWWLDVKSNINQSLATRASAITTKIYGNGAYINGTSAGAGAIRFIEQTEGLATEIQVNFFTNGIAFCMFNTGAAWFAPGVPNDNYSSCDGNYFSLLSGYQNLQTFASVAGPRPAGVPSASSPFNRTTLIAVTGITSNVANSLIIRTEGDWAGSCMMGVGGQYGFTATTGQVGFSLGGFLEGVTIIQPHIDNAGGYTSAAATDIIFAPSYQLYGDPTGWPVLLNVGFIKLPVGWWNQLHVIGGNHGIGTEGAFYDSAIEERGLYIYAHVPSGYHANSRMLDVGTLQFGQMLGIDMAGNALFRGTVNYLGTATGLVNVMALTPLPALTAYATGQRFTFKANITNTTTTPTLNLNGLGAKTIVKRAATALAAGDYLANMMCDVIYDGTNFQLLNPVVN